MTIRPEVMEAKSTKRTYLVELKVDCQDEHGVTCL